MMELHEKTAEIAQSIEQAESAEDAQLVGSTVLDVEYTVGRKLQVKEITVQFNSRNATVSVDLYSEALTVAEGFGDTRRVPLFNGDDTNTEDVIREAREFWEMQAEADGLVV